MQDPETVESLRCMPLHAELTIDVHDQDGNLTRQTILRVPGGWIYPCGDGGVFVPEPPSRKGPTTL